VSDLVVDRALGFLDRRGLCATGNTERQGRHRRRQHLEAIAQHDEYVRALTR
jgi:hypothetical protein